MIQIFKLKSTNTNYTGSDVALDEDIEIIGEFESFEEIAEIYGSADKWLGLELTKGKVVFNQERYDNHVRSNLPLAMGKDLKQSLMDNQSTLSITDINRVMDKIGSLYLTLENRSCNPFTEASFQETMVLLNSTFENGTKELIVNLVKGWAKTVRFAK